MGRNIELVPHQQIVQAWRILARGESYASRKRGRIKNRLRLGFIRAAEYPYVILFKRLLRENLGITLDLVIYENGMDLARDLSLLRLDLGISPPVTDNESYSGCNYQFIVKGPESIQAVYTVQPNILNLYVLIMLIAFAAISGSLLVIRRQRKTRVRSI